MQEVVIAKMLWGADHWTLAGLMPVSTEQSYQEVNTSLNTCTCTYDCCVNSRAIE